MNPLDFINKPEEKIYSGIVQNLRKIENNEKTPKKWINSIVKGVPFPIGKERYVFVIKDSANGGRGVRAIVYGQQAGAELHEGKICYLTGTTDKNGVIIGRSLYDPDTDSRIEADKVYSPNITRTATVLAILMLVYLVYTLSHIRFTTSSILGSQTRDMLSIVITFFLAVVCLRNKNRLVRLLGWLLLVVAIYTIYPPIVIMIVLFFIIKKVLFR